MHIQHTAYSIQHTAYSIQHTAYSIQHTAYSIQHTKIRKYYNYILINLATIFLFTFTVNAQNVRVIDNKGTLINFNNNKVFDQKNDPNTPPAIAITVERDIWLNKTTGIPETWHNNSWVDLISKEYAFPTTEISNPTTLTDNHYKIIITAVPSDPMINLPPASSSNKGKIYVIKNTTSTDTETNIPYKNSENDDTAIEIKANTMIILQSDGNIWQQIN